MWFRLKVLIYSSICKRVGALISGPINNIRQHSSALYAAPFYSAGPVIGNVGYRHGGVNRIHSCNVHAHSGREISSEVRWSQRCSCCGLNSKGEQELAEFLTDEICQEKQFLQECDIEHQLNCFYLTCSSGPLVTLTRKSEHEIIQVQFNVSNSLSEDLFADVKYIESGDDNDIPLSAPLVSRPSFVVKIDNAKDKLLVLHCTFLPFYENLQPGNFNSEVGTGTYDIAIESVTVLDRCQPCRDSETFHITASSLSVMLHKKLLLMLSTRGIDNSFKDQLVELSTTLEHRCYVQFLQQLLDFVRCTTQH